MQANKMSFETVPKELRGLRACLVCSLVKVRKFSRIENAIFAHFTLLLQF